MREDTETEKEDVLGRGAAGRVNAGVWSRRKTERGGKVGVRGTRDAATVPVRRELLLATRRGGGETRDACLAMC